MRRSGGNYALRHSSTSRRIGRMPAGIPPGPPATNLLAQFDAQAITSLADGATITTWADSTSNHHDLTGSQGTGGKPVYHNTGASLINGHPVALFTATSTNGMNMTSASFNTGTALSVGVVCTQPAAHGWGQPILSDQSISTGAFYFNNSQVPAMYDTAHVYTFGSAPAAGAHSYIWVNNGASTVLYVDGASIAFTGTGTPGAFGFSTGIEVGCQGGVNSYGGSIGELVIYNAALTPTVAATLHSYFASKWGVA